MNLSEFDLGYLAGAIDGEGTIKLGRGKPQREGWNPTYAPYIGACNTQMPFLERLKSLTGMGVLVPMTRSPRERPGWSWNLRVEEQKEFLPIVTPYLVSKVRQAELLAEFFSLALPHKGPGYTVPDSVVKDRDRIYRELRTPNKRGIQ